MVAIVVAIIGVMIVDGRLRRRFDMLRDDGSDPDAADVAPSGPVLGAVVE